MKLYLTINLEDRMNPYIINICQDKDKAEELIETYKNNYVTINSSAPEFTVATFDTNDGDFDVYDWAEANGYDEDFNDYENSEDE